jgi:cytochrome c553
MRYIILILLFLHSAQADALYNRGEYLYFSKACSSCHGPAAEGSSSAPKLANKSKKYLLEKLHIFKSGKVFTSNQEMMSQFVRVLNEKDIESLATFLSQHKAEEIPDVADDYLGGFGS